VVGHEYFHNWTGNRVTCRDWFQLSLKEGLTVFRDQEFSQDLAGDARRPAPSSASKTCACCAPPSSPKTPAPWPTRCARQLPGDQQLLHRHHLRKRCRGGAHDADPVGREGFAKGMKLYFERHDGQAVTCDDFAQAMADANPGSAWRPAAAVQALVQPGRHAHAARQWPL
jgi:aminopeptidase N